MGFEKKRGRRDVELEDYNRFATWTVSLQGRNGTIVGSCRRSTVHGKTRGSFSFFSVGKTLRYSDQVCCKAHGRMSLVNPISVGGVHLAIRGSWTPWICPPQRMDTNVGA